MIAYPISLLVVEDEPTDLLVIQATLRAAAVGPLEVSHVESLAEARQALEETEPDLVLLDLTLPDSRGLDTLLAVLECSPQVPIVVMTGTDDEAVGQQAVEQGAQDFLVKGQVDPRLLSRSIRYAIQRKRAEREVRDSEERFRTIFHGGPLAMATLGPEGELLQVNETLCHLFGRHREELEGTPFRDLLDRSAVADPPEGLRELLGGQCARYRGEVRGRAAGPSHPWLAITASEIRNHADQRVCVLVMLEDVTAERRLQKEILDISEQEQIRIGQDLHDRLGQELTGIAFLCKGLQSSLEAESHDRSGEVARVVELLNQSIVNARNLARGLHPVALEMGGLVDALQELAGGTEELFGIKCQVQGKPPATGPEEDREVAMHLYRIAQEAVTNAVKHGGASRVRIELKSPPGQLVLAVTDNGRGFPDPRFPSSGMGMHIMRYRAQVLGGTLTIRPAPGGGSVVRCSVPRPSEG